MLELATAVDPASFGLLTAVAQTDPGVDIDVSTGDGLFGGAIGSFATVLVVGAIMIALAPDYVERLMAAIAAEPVESFGYGIVSLFGLGLLILALVITIVGILVVLPLMLLAYLLWAIGAAIAYLAIADRLIGRTGSWLPALLVAATISGALALTGIGGLLSLCIGAAGFGAVIRDYAG
ncbi:hypothetical protein [Natronolimnohabitans innermongolicus]|uniref:DUF8173 domain-containing protein n=1 Tax=Natronolimnohabitans innermongolicus JCM 12255 TaxID=1227499 RepID=L9XJL6_9EURY|nr:hypothetical protein [Natronolimnohabitans innermongolicus]ELY61606.1 hypothetical protein C493_02041 [Natronolimnohabitans innermongolicus JCM 12255]